MASYSHAHVTSCTSVYAPCASQIWVYISDWSFYVTLQNPIILAQKWWAGTHCDFCFEDYLMTKVTRDILLCLYLYMFCLSGLNIVIKHVEYLPILVHIHNWYTSVLTNVHSICAIKCRWQCISIPRRDGTDFHRKHGASHN
jgi:hypothetical protein